MTEKEFNRALKLATFTVTGDLGLKAMLDLLSNMHAHPDFDGAYRVLCDYRQCNWAPMLEEFRRHEHSVVDLLNLRQPAGVVAFVLSSETERQILDQISSEYPWKTAWATFTCPDVAREWLLSQPVGTELPSTAV
ncbi:MAG: hypothetical protein AAF993_17950 [Pseudomonadota bacterium]